MGLIRRIREWWRRRHRKRGTAAGADGGERESQERAPRSGKTFASLESERYARGNFLHFGKLGGAYPAGLDLKGAADLLGIFGSDLYAPGMQDLEHERPYKPAPLLPGTHICDFCARPVIGGEYQVLRDGRERCAKCSRTVVKDAGSVKKIFREVKKRMELLYGIEFTNEVSVQVVSAKKLHKLSGREFVPTSGFDARAIGFALVKRGRQEVVLENGSPRASFISTTAHELTHCWQNQFPYFHNLVERVEQGSLSNEMRLMIVEGHATWSEVQYLFLIGEHDEAQFAMDNYLRRDDEYGRGFRMYMEKYGFSKTSVIVRDTPFSHPDNPLDL
ncbi:MAG: hypothetical protein IJ087_21345 [Eggerthellaceae bacterium]|nr:hypothetical protein [Eggerthellaceae bacterium]